MKDAPRLWTLRCHRTFTSNDFKRSRYEECVFHRYLKDAVEKEKKRRRLRKEDRWTLEDTEVARERDRFVEDCAALAVSASVNTHVDDVEVLAPPDQVPVVKKMLEKDFGPCKLQWKLWKHVGSEYRQSED